MLLDYLKSRLNLRLNNATNILIVINIAIWLIVLILKSIYFILNLTLPLQLLEVPSDLTLLRQTPWTLFTYSFLHTRFLHMLFNMLALYWFGHIAEEHYTTRQIIAIYILGGITGGLLFLLAFNTLPYFTAQFHQTYLLGASASVLAIATAAATTDPSRKINLFPLGEISLKWLAILIVFISFLGVTGSNAGGDIAHLGGALLGVIYALLQKPITKRLTRRHNIFTNHDTKHNTSSYHFQRGTRTDNTTHTNSDIDKILEKIKRSGYASLTDDEKQRLFKH